MPDLSEEIEVKFDDLEVPGWSVEFWTLDGSGECSVIISTVNRSGDIPEQHNVEITRGNWERAIAAMGGEDGSS